MNDLADEKIEDEALNALREYMPNKGKVIGVVQASSSQCIAILTEEFNNNKVGVVRQFLYNRTDKEPTLTKKV